MSHTDVCRQKVHNHLDRIGHLGSAQGHETTSRLYDRGRVPRRCSTHDLALFQIQSWGSLPLIATVCPLIKNLSTRTTSTTSGIFRKIDYRTIRNRRSESH